jgi:predicted metal-dependent HD superfamily phosphohydrolase
MKDFVLDLLNKNLSEFLFYHDQEHTLYVTDKVIEIGSHENCTAEEMELLCTAALWHDTGYIYAYAGHEEESCILAKAYLPAYGYSSNDIYAICGMIMATKIPQSPQNKLEEIIADADLEYLGSANAGKMAAKLFKELHHLNPLLTHDQWNETQISFLKQHKYFTRFCRKNAEPGKELYLKKLLSAKV